MDNPNPQSTFNPNVNWRGELTPQDRSRYVRQLAQSLKHLSPGTDDNSIFTAAKNFEYSIYSQSMNKNHYVIAYARKFNQIKHQIQMQAPVKVAPGGDGVDSSVTTTISPQQTQSPTSPQMQMMQQQTQSMSSAPTQQLFMQPQKMIQPTTISQSPLIQNQQIQNRHQNQISSEMLTSQQQQQVTMIQSTTLPMTSQTSNSHMLMTPSQQQQQQQLQIFLARQRALQQQQMNTGLANMNINRPSIPTNPVNNVSAAMQHIDMTRQNQTSIPMSQANPEMVTLFKLQREQLLQQQQLQLNSCNQADQPQLQHLHQRQIQQLQQNHSRQLQQQQQHRLTGFQQQSAQTNNFTQRQPIGNSIQQQQQQQQPFNSTPLLQQTQKTISAQQRIQATNMVRQLDENVRTTRVQSQALDNLTDQEKKAIWENMMQMRPLYEKIGQLLPIFLALTSNFEATRRLIMMKYMFEDQLNALPRNIYLMPLERLRQLGQQFNGYFAWVRNAVNGNAIPISQPQPRPEPQPLGQQLNLQPQGQGINQQTSPVSHAETPMNTTSSSNSPLIKRENIDLNLPPSKKQRATTEQLTTSAGQQQQQNSNSTDIPATVHWSQLENSPATIPDCAQASTKADTPPSTIMNTPTLTGLVPPATQHQNPGATTIQNDLQSQMVYQAAISSGIPSAIVAHLPARALKCSWLLHQGSLNKIKLADEQKLQIRRMLDAFIGQAKAQLGGKDHGIQQQQDTHSSDTNSFSKMDQQQLNTIDLTLSPPFITATNNSNCAMENSSAEKGIASTSSLSLQNSREIMKSEPISSTLSSSGAVYESTNATVPLSSTINTPIASTTTIQPAILTTSPVSTNLRPGMGLDDRVTNHMLYASNVLKDVATLMTKSSPLTETSSTPLFVMDDFIIDSNNNNNNKAGMTTQITGESYNNNINTTVKNAQAVLFSSSESPSSLVHGALKEGFKDETFCINELDSNNVSSTFNNGSSSSWLDQSSNSSSLSSTSLSSCEFNEDFVKNNWYQIGMDKDALGITETIPGLDFDGDGFISYDSGNRLSHPPLF